MSTCSICGKFILEAGVSYGINPQAVCKCTPSDPPKINISYNIKVKAGQARMLNFLLLDIKLKYSSIGGVESKLEPLTFMNFSRHSFSSLILFSIIHHIDSYNLLLSFFLLCICICCPLL
jgi:hypothetical protein